MSHTGSTGGGIMHSREPQLLLVEDTPGDILLIRRAIAQTGLTPHIRLAMDGEQATQILSDESYRPDLVILDVNIPKITGLALLERCRVAAPVVVFTSSSSLDDRLRAIALGAKDYVQKATDLEAFEQQVARIVQDWLGSSNLAAGAGN